MVLAPCCIGQCDGKVLGRRVHVGRVRLGSGLERLELFLLLQEGSIRLGPFSCHLVTKALPSCLQACRSLGCGPEAPSCPFPVWLQSSFWVS